MSNLQSKSNQLILHKIILDPLSTIIKLAVLGKKEIGSKILIKNNQIYIQENGMFQGISRYYMGVTKNDIHYISIPIELACKRYLNTDKINSTPDLIIIFKSAQDGLNNLMITYETHPIIVHCLKYYYTIIDSYLHLISCQQNLKSNNIEIYKKIEIKPTNKTKKISNNKNTDDSDSYHTPNLNYLNNEDLNQNMKNINLSNDQSIEIPQNSELTEEEKEQNNNELLFLYSNEILDKFDLIWDKSKIKIVIDMIKYLLEEKSALEYSAYIETFMIPIDKEILKIILIESK